MKPLIHWLLKCLSLLISNKGLVYLPWKILSFTWWSSLLSPVISLLGTFFFKCCFSDLYCCFRKLLKHWLINGLWLLIPNNVLGSLSFTYRVWLQTAFLASLVFNFSRSILHLMCDRPLTTDESTRMLSTQVSLTLVANWRSGFCSVRIVFLDEHPFCLLS